jgi:ATP-dependent RNA helicase DDX24/MAK5
VSAIQENADRTWLKKHAESMELELDDEESEEERVDNVRQRKATSARLNKLKEVFHCYSEKKFS